MRVARITILVAALTACVLSLSSAAQAEHVKRLRPITYRDMDGQTLRLVPWQGKHVTLLLPRAPRSPRVIGEIIGALDRSWNYYAQTAGRVPRPYNSLHGRDEIAEVPTLNSCGGAACTYLGYTGANILAPYFDQLYSDAAEHHEYDQALFYEFGRSFWFWGRQLAVSCVTGGTCVHPHNDPVANLFSDSVITGYAVLMRWESMRAERIPGGPVLDPGGSGQQVSFLQGRRDMVALLGYYDRHPELTFADTIGQDRSPAPGLLQGTDFWASIMWHLAARHGGDLFLRRFFHHAHTLSRTTTVQAAVANWVRDANYAACVNLAPLFYRQWGFPRPDGRVTRRPPAGTVHEPRGSCRATRR